MQLFVGIIFLILLLALLQAPCMCVIKKVRASPGKFSANSWIVFVADWAANGCMAYRTAFLQNEIKFQNLADARVTNKSAGKFIQKKYEYEIKEYN